MIRRDRTPRLFGGWVFHGLMAPTSALSPPLMRELLMAPPSRARVEHLAMPAGAVSPFFRGVEEFLYERIAARCVQTRAFRAPPRAGNPT